MNNHLDNDDAALLDTYIAYFRNPIQKEEDDIYAYDNASLEFSPDPNATSSEKVVYGEHIRDFFRDQIKEIIARHEGFYSSYSIETRFITIKVSNIWKDIQVQHILG